MQSGVVQAKAPTQPLAERQIRRDKLCKYFMNNDWSQWPLKEVKP
jgi:hypothetical protein